MGTILVFGPAARLVPHFSFWTAQPRTHPQTRRKQADRRSATKAIGIGGLAAALAPPDALERIAEAGDRPVDMKLVTAHEALADALASFHRISPPDVLGRLVANQADMLLGLLDRPLSPAVRARLDATAVGSHSQTGLLAFFAGDRTTARRMLAVAEKVATDADDQDPLRAQVLGAVRAWSKITLLLERPGSLHR